MYLAKRGEGMEIKHGYQPKEPLHKEDLIRADEEEAVSEDIMRIATKLLWLQAAISAIALIISIVALIMKLHLL